MTILFADIRSFTRMSESMSPEENFNFLNSFLREIGPVIRLNSGFIDKYIGDAIMALFPEEPGHALYAALQMLEKVDELNKSHQKDALPCIEIGIGIHTGDTMLGIIGEAERFEGTVISDAVNLASRLEGVTKKVNVPILFSEAVARAVSNDFALMRIGTAKVKGKTKRIGMYTLKSLLNS